MFQLHPLSKENELNRIISQQKRTGGQFYILFHSLWDPYSQEIVEKVNQRYQESQGDTPLYLSNTFYMPHSILVYKDKNGNIPSVVPLLVGVGKRVTVEDYIPHIYKTLDIK